jgi:putative transposase
VAQVYRHATTRIEAEAANLLQQQARFDTFVAHDNRERPHQALDMAVPAARYARSARPFAASRA